MKKKIAIISVILLLILSGTITPISAQGTVEAQPGESTSSGDMIIYDLVIVRPVSLGACAVGLAGAIVALPFALLSGSTHVVGRELIKKPFDYTFQRPLGDFGSEYENRQP